jgi:hypothetical protein
MSLLAVTPYLDWLVPIVKDAWADAWSESNPVQLGKIPQAPQLVRPYIRIQIPVIPQEPQSIQNRWHQMITTITRYGVYTDKETPLLFIQEAEANALIAPLMRVVRPFSGANLPRIEQVVFDANDTTDEQASAEDAYQTTVAFSLSISRNILTT